MTSKKGKTIEMLNRSVVAESLGLEKGWLGKAQGVLNTVQLLLYCILMLVT